MKENSISHSNNDTEFNVYLYQKDMHVIKANEELKNKLDIFLRSFNQDDFNQIGSLYYEISGSLPLIDKIKLLNYAIKNSPIYIKDTFSEQISKEILSQKLSIDNVQSLSKLIVETREKEVIDMWISTMAQIQDKKFVEAGITAIISAYTQGYDEIVHYLITKKEILKTIGQGLTLAIAKKDNDIFDKLLEIDSHLSESIIPNKFKETALQASVKCGDKDKVEILLHKFNEDISFEAKTKAVDLCAKLSQNDNITNIAKLLHDNIEASKHQLLSDERLPEQYENLFGPTNQVENENQLPGNIEHHHDEF